MPFDPTQPYATASGAGGEWYIQDGQAYSLNGVAITAPVAPATRNQATGPFTGLSDLPNSYSGQGGKSVTVKESEDGIEFAAGGGGGGATAFTDLTDAPATITAKSLLSGNDDGDALLFRPNLTFLSDLNSFRVIDTTARGDGTGVGDPTQTEIYIETRDTVSNSHSYGRAILNPYWSYTDDAYSVYFALQIADASNASAGLVIDINSNGSPTAADAEIALSKTSGIFKMSGFDVVASDATATMTVNAVEYSIAKAIKVKIGSDTYFWPLFGPVAP